MKIHIEILGASITINQIWDVGKNKILCVFGQERKCPFAKFQIM